MALPNVKKTGEPADNRKGKAVLKLVFTVLVIDAIAVTAFFALTLVLGWDQMVPLIMVILVAVMTGFYYQWKLKQINR